MDTRGSCCIARYSATGAYDMSKMNTIMLKFRPIAPKPATGTAVSDVSSSESGGGTKRKYAKDNNNKKRCNRNTRRRRKTTTPSPVVTLPLLPESPDPKDPPPAPEKKSSNTVPVWLSFEDVAAKKLADVDPAGLGGGSVVTVESVTDTWLEDEHVLGGTDEERKVQLSGDTCPGFISDGDGRVTWTNGAYREMVGEERLWVVMKVGLPYRGFTCRVRVQYGGGGCVNKERSSVMAAPCDVWRMESGGFAWRLDVKAALSLSLSL